MRKGWKKLNLESLGFVGRGKSRHRPRNAEFLYGSEYPFVQTADIKAANYRITSYSQMYSEEGLKQSKLWPIDTLCITIAANIADSALLGIEACFPDSVIGFIPDEDKADVRFVKYLFDLLQVRIKQISQGAAQDNLSMEKLRTIKFDVPPLKTQRKIAAILSAYDDLIENNLKRIALLEEQAQQTYEEWFVRFRFPGHESVEIDEESGLPEGWEKKRLNEVAKLNSMSLKKDFKGRIKYIDIASVSIGKVDSTITYNFSNAPGRAKRIVQHGDIIWSCVRPNRKSHSVIWNPENNLIASTGFCVISPKYLPTSYLLKYLTTDSFVAYLTNLAGGAAYPAVKTEDFRDAEVVVPKKTIVDKFDNIFKNSLDISSNLQTQNHLLKEARDILLPRLMGGMIDADNIEVHADFTPVSYRKVAERSEAYEIKR